MIPATAPGAMSADAELATPGAAGAGSAMLGALAIVARHRGIHLSPVQLGRDHQLGPGEPSLRKLLDIARASGMRAVATRLKFRDLMGLGAALPAILLLKNGSPMVLLRSEPQTQPPHVIVQTRVPVRTLY